MEYTVEFTSFWDFEAWSGGKDTLEDIKNADKMDELYALAKEIFFDRTPSDTEINDWLWFDRDSIYDSLGMNDDEEDEEDDDEEDEDEEEEEEEEEE